LLLGSCGRAALEWQAHQTGESIYCRISQQAARLLQERGHAPLQLRRQGCHLPCVAGTNGSTPAHQHAAVCPSLLHCCTQASAEVAPGAGWSLASPLQAPALPPSLCGNTYQSNSRQKAQAGAPGAGWSLASQPPSPPLRLCGPQWRSTPAAFRGCGRRWAGAVSVRAMDSCTGQTAMPWSRYSELRTISCRSCGSSMSSSAGPLAAKRRRPQAPAQPPAAAAQHLDRLDGILYLEQPPLRAASRAAKWGPGPSNERPRRRRGRARG